MEQRLAVHQHGGVTAGNQVLVMAVGRLEQLQDAQQRPRAPVEPPRLFFAAACRLSDALHPPIAIALQQPGGAYRLGRAHGIQRVGHSPERGVQSQGAGLVHDRLTFSKTENHDSPVAIVPVGETRLDGADLGRSLGSQQMLAKLSPVFVEALQQLSMAVFPGAHQPDHPTGHHRVARQQCTTSIIEQFLAEAIVETAPCRATTGLDQRADAALMSVPEDRELGTQCPGGKHAELPKQLSLDLCLSALAEPLRHSKTLGQPVAGDDHERDQDLFERHRCPFDDEPVVGHRRAEAERAVDIGQIDRPRW